MTGKPDFLSPEESDALASTSTPEQSAKCRPYREGLLQALADPAEAIHYLQDARDSGIEAFRKAVRNVAAAAESRTECACKSCGYMGENFRTIEYHDGDYDAECPECMGTDVGEPEEVLRALVCELDEANAKIDDVVHPAEEG